MTNIDNDADNDNVYHESGQHENEENSLGCTKQFVNLVVVESQCHISSNLKQFEYFTLPTP